MCRVFICAQLPDKRSIDISYHRDERLIRVFAMAKAELLEVGRIVGEVRDGEVHLAQELVCNLEHTIAPVAGAYRCNCFVEANLQARAHLSRPSRSRCYKER